MPTPESPNNQEPSPAPQSEPAPAPTPAPSPAPQAVKEFTVTAKNWEFAPSSITVKKGDRVRLKITSVDVAHGLALTDFNVSVHVEPGQTQTVEFVADKVGTFTFFCNVFCGEGHRGMKGIFVVQP
jgi:cytochrome c oxidase subunit 2